MNDAPALKRANIGAAMGGPDASDVAREAADIVLLDDKFDSLVVAIEEGRTIFDNLKKTILYTISHIMPEVVAVAYLVIFSFPTPLSGLAILTIDLITEQGPSASFALEPAENNVMERQPRDLSKDRLITRNMFIYIYLIVGMVASGVCTLAYFGVYWYHGISLKYIWQKGDDYWVSPDGKHDHLNVGGGRILNKDEQEDIYRQSHAAFYLTLIMNQAWHVWHCKTRQASLWKHPVWSNIITYMGVAFAIVFMCLIVYVPALQDVFEMAAPPGYTWLYSLIFLVFIHLYSEFYKWAARNRPDSLVARYLAY